MKLAHHPHTDRSIFALLSRENEVTTLLFTLHISFLFVVLRFPMISGGRLARFSSFSKHVCVVD